MNMRIYRGRKKINPDKVDWDNATAPVDNAPVDNAGETWDFNVVHRSQLQK